jgi:transcriptional regulator with XRE-family HTH domain
MDNSPLFLRVRYERLRRRLSIKNAGRLAGLTTAEISLLESGRLTPSPSQMARLGKAYQVEPASLLFKPVSIQDDSETVAEGRETTTA